MNSVKVGNENTTNRAIISAESAFGTERIIDVSKIILNLNSARGTVLFALLTTDAGVRAFRASNRSFFFIIAGHEHVFLVGHKSYKTLRAGTGTNSASDANSGVDVSNTVLQADSVLGASGKAIAKAHTTKTAFSFSAVHRFSRLAAAYSNVVHLVYCMSAVAIAMYNGNLLDNVLGFLTKYFRNLLCNGIRTGNTEVRFNRIIIGKSLCIAVASGVSASATVSAGQTFTNIIKFFVLRNGKELCGKHKHYSA